MTKINKSVTIKLKIKVKIKIDIARGQHAPSARIDGQVSEAQMTAADAQLRSGWLCSSRATDRVK